MSRFRHWSPGPIMGHLSDTGFWHPGTDDGCPKCDPPEVNPIRCERRTHPPQERTT